MSHRRPGTWAKADRVEDRLLEQLAFETFCARHPWLTREQAAQVYKAQEKEVVTAARR